MAAIMQLSPYTITKGNISTTIESSDFVRLGDDLRVKRTVEALRRLMVRRAEGNQRAMDYSMLNRAEAIIALFCKWTEPHDDFIVKAGLGPDEELTVILSTLAYDREISVDFTPESNSYCVFKTTAEGTTESDVASLGDLAKFIQWVIKPDGV